MVVKFKKQTNPPEARNKEIVGKRRNSNKETLSWSKSKIDNVLFQEKGIETK